MPAEIEEHLNRSRVKLLEAIKRAKDSGFDYTMVMFSGHGGQKRETVLELNARGEQINESELWNISSRQTNIFDCCRALMPETVRKSMAMDSLRESAALVSSVRARYEQRIMQAIPQQVRLYACAVGQSAYDMGEGKGALYLGNLLDAACSLPQGERFKAVETAHAEVRAATMVAAAKNGVQQNPDAFLPKCLSEQRLILSIAP
jgi:hypothetical protein